MGKEKRNNIAGKGCQRSFGNWTRGSWLWTTGKAETWLHGRGKRHQVSRGPQDLEKAPLLEIFLNKGMTENKDPNESEKNR